MSKKSRGGANANLHIVEGPVATAVEGFANGITGTPPAPRERGDNGPPGSGPQLPRGEKSKSSKSPNPFGFKSSGGK